MMRLATLAVLATFATIAVGAPGSAAPPVVVASVSAEPLLGQWRVDLTASPAEGVSGRYYTDMVIERQGRPGDRNLLWQPDGEWPHQPQLGRHPLCFHHA